MNKEIRLLISRGNGILRKVRKQVGGAWKEIEEAKLKLRKFVR